MIRFILLITFAALTLGCAGTRPIIVEPTVFEQPVVEDTVGGAASPAPIRATRVDGGLRLQGVAGQVLANGELLIAGGGFRLIVFRSSDEGISFLPLRAPDLAATTPNIAVVAGMPAIAYTAFHREHGQQVLGGVRLLLATNADGRWFEHEPITITDVGVDPHLLPLRNGRLLCFVVLGETSLGVFASDDDGATWYPFAEPVRNAQTRLEDGKAIELSNGDVLYAYEAEPEENGPSSILMLRSTDSGLTWTLPQPLWDPPEPADVEPGGFVRDPNGALLFFVSSDEDPEARGTSYLGARVRALVSHDHGETWQMHGPVVEEADQVVFHAFLLQHGGVGLLTIRHWNTGNRALAVYHLDAGAVARLVAPQPFSRRPHAPHP